ncbi:hypothetical protein SEA_TYPHA_4 [Mycobacterium phage Typha]|uniref:Uncharacterized protein n=1 Tax=Mycobacterium phage Typha TaxID=2517971 RepID=A0A482JCG7_9CAUD|nr:hypothetical protein KCH40_gp004 [Mycobacterium phage Typha]QBP29661.1 hypothetical protein SEA_TYPHA_4 [Mycobacterium phage Typha]URM86448.1 hypothetical protein PBI_HILLTOPFARM_4 [Mycobacterium phage Hilltopfarm]
MSEHRMTITIGPLTCVFGNHNKAMGLKLHFHTAAVFLEYSVPVSGVQTAKHWGGHGFPSFEATNDALRDRVRELTAAPFEDATNEDVAWRLFQALKGFRHGSWDRYGGDYRLIGLDLDVVGVPDSIGHDDGTTRYTIKETS